MTLGAAGHVALLTRAAGRLGARDDRSRALRGALGAAVRDAAQERVLDLVLDRHLAFSAMAEVVERARGQAARDDGMTRPLGAALDLGEVLEASRPASGPRPAWWRPRTP